MNTNSVIAGTTRWPRTKVTRATWRASSISRSAPATLAITSVHISEKVMSSLVVSISGPGVMFWIMSAPRRIAIEALPGMPNATVGMRAPPFIALLAVSGAITPRTSPLPNPSLSLLLWTTWP